MSRPFEFRLARVLRVRSLEEELARSAWQTAVQAARSADERATDLRTRRDTALAELAAAMRSGLAPAAWVVQAGIIDRVSDSIVAADERARTLEKQAEALVEPLRERHTEVRKLERLRDKQAAVHRLECTRKDAVLMDEVALTRAAWAPLAPVIHDVPDAMEPPTDRDPR
jgi:flagellar export protein FliJ